MLVVYIFDFIVAIILSVDFYFRMKFSKDSYLRFFLRHMYEIPLVIFAILIKHKIDEVGNLTQNDFEDLMLSIRNLRDMESENKKRSKNSLRQNLYDIYFYLALIFSFNSISAGLPLSCIPQH
jgi:hypothetical protein